MILIYDIGQDILDPIAEAVTGYIVASSDVPANALLNADGSPLLNADGSYILNE